MSGIGNLCSKQSKNVELVGNSSNNDNSQMRMGLRLFKTVQVVLILILERQ